MHIRSACIAAAAFSLVAGVYAQDPDGKSTSQSNPPATAVAPGTGSSVQVFQNGGGGSPQAANANLTLVRQWDRAPGVQYNDIWGWTAPDGREFAYVGETRGIWFVETTDPQNIRQIGWWSAPDSTWRDFDNLGHYVYSVSEHHSGIRIFDMSNPDSPRDLGYVATSQIRNAHNITADRDTGYLYLSGTNQGLAIFDASQSRTNPQLVGTWRPNRTYTHDCCVLRGKAYLSNGRSYTARIMDATNPANLIEIGRCNTPGGYDHNVWVSDDDQVLCVTDEITRNGQNSALTIWDISNPRTPVLRDDYNLRSIVHNVFILGRTAYMSHYTDGVHVIDITNPSNVSAVANYDTSTVSSGYNGAWGVHPFSDSGLIYVSDMQNGLYVFEMQCGHMNRYGDPTQGTGGRAPRAIFADATPRVGATGLKLDIDGMAPNARGFLFVGFAPGSLSVAGVDIHIDPTQSFSVDVNADANGEATIPLPIPNNAAAASFRVYMQIVAQDAGGPQGWTASRGMWMGICQ